MVGRARYPGKRSGLERALETLHIPYAELLLVKCSGLSLSDQYWVTPCDAPQNWRDVNFYENDFSDDVGRALFGEGVLSAQPDLCSPCNTSDGFLQKRWRIADRKRILLKAGSAFTSKSLTMKLWPLRCMIPSVCRTFLIGS